MEIVKIKKVDETFIKIIADPSIVMELAQEFIFDVPGAQFSPKFKNKIWDGKIRLLNPMTGQLYAGLLFRIEEICKERNFTIEYLSDFSSAEFSVKECEDFIKKINSPIEPRDYQLEAFIHSVRNHRSLLLSPTGSGKSYIIYLLSRFYATKTLIIVPTINLVSQLYTDFSEYGFDSNKYVHRIYYGEDKNTDKPITISTWQSIYNLDEKYFSQFKLVIGDECHLFSAKSLKSIMEMCNKTKYRFGFTGTLDGTKTNEMVLEGLFGPSKRVATTSDLIEKGYLSKLKIKAIVFSYSDEVKKIISKKFKEYKDEIKFITDLPERNRFISNLSLSLKGNTLILFRFTDQGKNIYEKIIFENPKKNVFFINGDIKGDVRETIRKTIETEENAIIVASVGKIGRAHV